MIRTKILNAVIVVAAFAMFSSQKSAIDSLPVDSIVFKADSIATDIKQTAKRVEIKAARLATLNQEVKMQQALRSRIKINVSEISPKELPVNVDSLKVDPPQIPHKHKFRFWRK